MFKRDKDNTVDSRGTKIKVPCWKCGARGTLPVIVDEENKEYVEVICPRCHGRKCITLGDN